MQRDDRFECGGSRHPSLAFTQNSSFDAYHFAVSLLQWKGSHHVSTLTQSAAARAARTAKIGRRILLASLFGAVRNLVRECSEKLTVEIPVDGAK